MLWFWLPLIFSVTQLTFHCKECKKGETSLCHWGMRRRRSRVWLMCLRPSGLFSRAWLALEPLGISHQARASCPNTKRIEAHSRYPPRETFCTSIPSARFTMFERHPSTWSAVPEIPRWIWSIHAIQCKRRETTSESEIPVSVPASVPASGAVGPVPFPPPPPPPVTVSCSARTTSSTTATARKMTARNYWTLTPNTREVNNGEVNTESEMWPLSVLKAFTEKFAILLRGYGGRGRSTQQTWYALTCSMRFGSQFTACTSLGEACMVREGVRIVQFRCRHSIARSIAWKNHHRYLFDGFSAKPSVSCLLNP
jgi:hypothetical protein